MFFFAFFGDLGRMHLILEDRTNRAPDVTIVVARRIDIARKEAQVVGAAGIARAERRRPVDAARTATEEARAIHEARGGEENSFAGIGLVNEKNSFHAISDVINFKIGLVKPIFTACANVLIR